MNSNRKINWLNTLFLIFTPIVGVVGAILLSIYAGVHWQTWVFAFFFMFVTGMSVTGGYHRLFSHRSYEASWPIRLFFLLFGAGAFEGSALEWSTDHRNHHRYVDTDKDPYSINKGFWYAHIGWLVTLNTKLRDFSNVNDLTKDPLLRFQHRFFIPLGIVFGFLVPMGVAALWGDALGGLIIAGALRIAVNHHLTFAINSVCHTFGKRNYCDVQSAKDNWFTAIFTYGEGYHSFHHKFAVDYRNGVRAYHFDPTKWLIKTLAWFGLAKNLKKISRHRILSQRILIKQKALEAKLKQQQNETHESWWHVFENLRTSTQHILQKVEKLETEHSKLRRLAHQSAERKSLRNQLKESKKILKNAYSELKGYLSLWGQLHRQFYRFA